MKLVEPLTFRATTEAWLGQLLLPVGFFVLLILTAVNSGGISLGLGALALIALTLFVSVDYLIPMARNWLYLDDLGIEGYINGRYFHVYWCEVEAAWQLIQRGRRFLCLGTRGGTMVIPLRFLDDCALWEQVRSTVPPEALKENAYQMLPDYQAWEAARERFLSSSVQRQVTDHWLQQIVGWLGVVLFGFGLLDIVRSYLGIENLGLLGICLAFLVLCLSLVLNWGVTQADSDEIRRYSLFGCWSITWNEVRQIEFDLLESAIVFIGEERQLAVPGPWLWCGPCKKEMFAYLVAMAEHHGIPLVHSPLALFKVSHNTRAKKKSEDQS